MAGALESPRNPRDSGKFRELDRLVSADGLVGVISQRIETGVITFAIVRQFPQSGSGEMQKTSFIPEHMAESMKQMVDTVSRRIAQIRKDGLAPPALRARRG